MMTGMRRNVLRLAATLLVTVGCMSATGCYERVISSRGIGSDSSSVEYFEPNRKEDPIDRLLYGKSDKNSGSYKRK